MEARLQSIDSRLSALEDQQRNFEAWRREFEFNVRQAFILDKAQLELTKAGIPWEDAARRLAYGTQLPAGHSCSDFSKSPLAGKPTGW